MKSPKLKRKTTTKDKTKKTINDKKPKVTKKEEAPPVQSEQARKGRPRSSKSKHYVDNARFMELIKEYYKTDIFTEELGEMINKISEHVTYMPSFINYTYHDSMISDSNYKMVKALNERKFDPERGSPFSYFTKICIRAFIHILKKEKKNEITVENYQNELYDELILHGFSSGVDTENIDE